MDFAGPIPYKNNTQNKYILVTVDRLSRYPHAEIFKNGDTNTAMEYLESYCKVHGVPRSIRCDHAQAFKEKEFDIFCKNKNIKLILAPADDHRGTGMFERLIQTIKRRLPVLDIDPNWSNTTLANRLANKIENIRLIPTPQQKYLHSKHELEENQTQKYQTSRQKHHTKPHIQKSKKILFRQTAAQTERPHDEGNLEAGRGVRRRPRH